MASHDFRALKSLLTEETQPNSSSSTSSSIPTRWTDCCRKWKEDEEVKIDLDFLESAKYYLKLASAASQKTEEELEKALELPKECIILTKLASSPFQPAHFLAIDESKGLVILSIRGTKSASDILTDYQWTAIPFPRSVLQLSRSESPQKRLCHDGFLRSAMWIIDEIKPVLIGLFKTRNNNNNGNNNNNNNNNNVSNFIRLRIVGHSLGGAVAALIALLLKDDFPSLYAIAFGSPACVSQILSQESRSCVISFTNNNDVLPRLSRTSIIERIRGGGINSIVSSQILPDSQRLVPVGRLFHIVCAVISTQNTAKKEKEGNTTNTTSTNNGDVIQPTIFEVPPSFYEELPWNSVSVNDHRKATYLIAFETLINSYKSQLKETK